MGHRIDSTVYVLHFPEDHPLDGAKIRARSASTRTWMTMSKLREDDEIDAFVKVLQMLVDRLIEWNLVDDEYRPMPLTVDTLLDMEAHVATSILDAWFQAVAGVSPRNASPSTDGDASLEASLPMEVSSASQAS